MPAVIFNIDGSARHEIISLPSDIDLNGLVSLISTTIASSPNCAEFMAKYKRKDETEEQKVGDIKVRWSSAARDSKNWPQTTIVTEENCKAVFELMDSGRDVLEVNVA